MSWNYRILAHETSEEGIMLQVHEVYYNEEGIPNSYTERGIIVNADNSEGINWVLDKMKEGAGKSILWAGDRFPEEYKETKNET